MLTLGDSREDLARLGPYYAYGVFGGYVGSRGDQGDFLKSVGKFANELAESKDPLLRDLLITAILERVAQQPGTAAKLRTYLAPYVQSMLTAVEKDWFGRTTDPAQSST